MSTAELRACLVVRAFKRAPSSHVTIDNIVEDQDRWGIDSELESNFTENCKTLMQQLRRYTASYGKRYINDLDRLTWLSKTWRHVNDLLFIASKAGPDKKKLPLWKDLVKSVKFSLIDRASNSRTWHMNISGIWCPRVRVFRATQCCFSSQSLVLSSTFSLS
jgi:hypothetical protein